MDFVAREKNQHWRIVTMLVKKQQLRLTFLNVE